MKSDYTLWLERKAIALKKETIKKHHTIEELETKLFYAEHRVKSLEVYLLETEQYLKATIEEN